MNCSIGWSKKAVKHSAIIFFVRKNFTYNLQNLNNTNIEYFPLFVRQSSRTNFNHWYFYIFSRNLIKKIMQLFEICSYFNSYSLFSNNIYMCRTTIELSFFFMKLFYCKFLQVFGRSSPRYCLNFRLGIQADSALEHFKLDVTFSFTFEILVVAFSSHPYQLTLISKSHPAHRISVRRVYARARASSTTWIGQKERG